MERGTTELTGIAQSDIGDSEGQRGCANALQRVVGELPWSIYVNALPLRVVPPTLRQGKHYIRNSIEEADIDKPAITPSAPVNDRVPKGKGRPEQRTWSNIA